MGTRNRLADLADLPATNSAWYSTHLDNGNKDIKVEIQSNEWRGTIEVWIIGKQTNPTIELKFEEMLNSGQRILPPNNYQVGQLPFNQKLLAIEW